MAEILDPPIKALDNSQKKVVKHILCMQTQLPNSFLGFHLRQTTKTDQIPDEVSKRDTNNESQRKEKQRREQEQQKEKWASKAVNELF